MKKFLRERIFCLSVLLVFILMPNGVFASVSEAWPFEPDHVLLVKIQMNPQQWDTLRKQTRTNEQGPWGKGCFSEPGPTPFTYFPARLDIDGQVFENVAIRKKGMFGSLDDKRPSLKINFSKFSKGRRLAGLKKLTLNNSLQDPSIVRQCLGYELFRQAGVVASRCSFAHVTVNDVSLGVYVNVESVDKRFIKRQLGDESLCLEEGAESDFRPGWVRSFEHKFGPEEKCRRSLDSIVDLFLDSDSAIAGRLEKYMDLDSFYTFWAIEALVGDDDGYTSAANNFFVARGADGLWHFIPWGIDEIMQGRTQACEPYCQYARTYSILTLRLWLIPKMRQAFVSRLLWIMDKYWDEEQLVSRAEKMEQLIWPFLDKGQVQAMPEAMENLVDFVCSRREFLHEEIQMGPFTVRPFYARAFCK